MDILQAKERIVDFIRKKCEGAGVTGSVVGISGGVDSALVAHLAVEALGAENVLGLHLPELNVTPPEDVLDATEVAHGLGIEFRTIDIGGIVQTYLANMPGSDPSNKYVNGNLKARIRMSILYYYANLGSRLVAGTGNKTELLLGYYTKYGDGGVDLEPIGDLYKTEVFQMAEITGVSGGIIDKSPSAALWEDQTDENELGHSYDTIDNILIKMLAGEEAGAVALECGVPESELDKLLQRVDSNMHKRMLPPVADLADIRS
jgi:NAD+ synthase